MQLMFKALNFVSFLCFTGNQTLDVGSFHSLISIRNHSDELDVQTHKEAEKLNLALLFNALSLVRLWPINLMFLVVYFVTWKNRNLQNVNIIGSYDTDS